MSRQRFIMIGVASVHVGAAVGLLGGYLNANDSSVVGANIGAGIMEESGTLMFVSGVILEVLALIGMTRRNRSTGRRTARIDPPPPSID